MDDENLKIPKVPVVSLNGPLDFAQWHVALRRLVKGCNMADALLFSIPEGNWAAFQKRYKEMQKVEEEIKSKEAEQSVKEEKPKKVIDLSFEALKAPKTASDLAFLKVLGVPQMADDFFSALLCSLTPGHRRKKALKRMCSAKPFGPGWRPPSPRALSNG